MCLTQLLSTLNKYLLIQLLLLFNTDTEFEHFDNQKDAITGVTHVYDYRAKKDR